MDQYNLVFLSDDVSFSKYISESSLTPIKIAAERAVGTHPKLAYRYVDKPCVAHIEKLAIRNRYFRRVKAEGAKRDTKHLIT